MGSPDNWLVGVPQAWEAKTQTLSRWQRTSHCFATPTTSCRCYPKTGTLPRHVALLACPLGFQLADLGAGHDVVVAGLGRRIGCALVVVGRFFHSPVRFQEPPGEIFQVRA